MKSVHCFVLFSSLAVLTACGPTATAPIVPATPAIPAAPVGPPPVAGVIAGPLGSSLTEADRRTAFDAQIEALEKGQKKSWKAKTGTSFGSVEPGSESGGCREYTHTVYIDGRPRSEKGQGCRGAGGEWSLKG